MKAQMNAPFAIKHTDEMLEQDQNGPAKHPCWSELALRRQIPTAHLPDLLGLSIPGELS